MQVDKITSADRIAEYHRFACDGKTSTESKIREFKREYGKYYNHLLELTLK